MPTFLRDPSDTSGALKRFDDDEDARRAILDFGWQEATEDEVQARTLERTHGGRNTEAFLNSAAAGAFDVAVAPAKLLAAGSGALSRAMGDEASAAEFEAFNQQISGRQFMENLTAVATELAGGGNAEAAALRYREDTQKVAEANPWASTSGYLGGQVLGGVASGLAGATSSLGKAAASAATSSALGRSVLTTAVEGAAEGALVAGGQATEDAWIKNEKLSSEQLMASVGWGTLLGGGAGAALGGGIYGTGAVYRGGKRAAGEAGERLRSVFGPRATASADTVAEVASGALGVPVNKAEAGKIKDALNYVRDKIEDAQVATTGADPEALKKYGGMRWDADAVAGRDAYINRDTNIEGAKLAVNDSLQKLSNSVEPVIDEIRYSGLKREHVAAAIDKDKAAIQLADARTQAQAIESMVVPMRRPGSAARATREAGKDLDIDREAYLSTFDPNEQSAIDDELDDEIRDSLDALGKKTDEGTRAWKRVEQDVLRERVSKQKPMEAPLDPREGALRAELGNAGVLDEVERHVSRHTTAIAKTQDPVEAFMLIDNLKRGLQKYADRTGKSARALLGTSPERAAGMRKVSDLIERFQEPARQSLENEAVWGKAATNQRAINAALTRYIEGNKVFQARFMRETVGYRGLDVTRTVREDATSAFLNRLGLAENQASEQHLRAHLRATDDVLSALDGALDLGEKKALVQNAIGETKRVSQVIGDLDRNVKVANQIDALLKADGGGVGSAGKTLVGSILGGAPGALLGYAADVATHPGASMRTAIGVQRLANRHNVKIDEAVDRFFGAPRPNAKAAREAVDTTAAPANDTAATAPDADVFPDEVSEVRRRPRSSRATAAGAAIPVTLAAFLGSHEDKQSAFVARAKEIREATADMGEKIRAVVVRDMADVSESFPGFTGSLAAGMTRAALFLESKLPRSYRAAAPGAIGRSTTPVADHDIAKFARYWSAVHDPISVLHDMALGTVSGEQIEAVKAVYPELWVDVSGRLLERAAELDAKGQRLPMQTRLQLGRFVGVQIEPAFRSSVIGLLDQARQGREQAGGQGMNTSAPLELTTGTAPESVQIQQRAGRVG
jgi:hypothetical protein